MWHQGRVIHRWKFPLHSQSPLGILSGPDRRALLLRSKVTFHHKMIAGCVTSGVG